LVELVWENGHCLILPRVGEMEGCRASHDAFVPGLFQTRSG
jgi:hypothetical protein